MPVSMATKAINSLHVTYISTTPFRTGSEQVEARPPATPVSILYCHGISALLLRVGRRVCYYSKTRVCTSFLLSKEIKSEASTVTVVESLNLNA